MKMKNCAFLFRIPHKQQFHTLICQSFFVDH